MTHWVVWGGVTVLLMVVSWAAGRWLGTDPADDDFEQDAYIAKDGPAIEPDRVYLPRTGAFDWVYQSDWREQTAHDLAPAVLEAENVPEPGHGAQRDAATGMVTPDETAGLGHPSPYQGNLTAAQRRRDKHKQRGQYAPGQLPDPPADIGAWWAGELAALLEEGQSEWLTRNLAAA